MRLVYCMAHIQTALIYLSILLQEASVRRIAIGIGNEINIGELRQIASNNEDALQVSSYSSLYSKLEQIMKLACEQQNLGELRLAYSREKQILGLWI